MRSRGLQATSGAAAAVLSPARQISVLPSLRLFQAGRTLVSVSAGSSLSLADGISKSDDVAYAIHAACLALGKAPGEEEGALIRQLKAADFTTAQELATMTAAEARLLGVPLQLSLTVADLLEGRPAGLDSSAEAIAASGKAAAPAAPAAAAAVAPKASKKNQQAAQRPGPGPPAGKSLPQQAVELLKSTLSFGQAAASVPGSASAVVEGLAAPPPAPPAGAQDGEPALAVAAATSDEEDEDGSEFSEADLSADDLEGPHANNVVPASGSGWNAYVPIEERVCPPLNRFNHTAADSRNVSKRQGRPARYAIRLEDMTPGLAVEFADFNRFHTTRFFGQQSEPIAPCTAAKYADHLRGLLGYMHADCGVPLADLSLRSAIPSAKRQGVAIAFNYIQWLYRERDISVRTEGLVVRSVMAAAKWLYHDESRMQAASGDKPYSDLELIQELRKMSNSCKKASKVAARSSDEELKWVSWPEYLALCAELRKECAGVDARGRKRAEAAVAWSLQRYVIFAILSCVPDRQRTLRELEVGRTLIKDSNGRWIIRHGPGDYKTGKAYGERPPLIIAPHIYPELEAYIGKWRAHLNPSHALLFTQLNGEPMTDKALYKLHWTTSYRITGKKCNPHLVRDSIVTYLRGGGATERELEALAIYMGHSMAMQRDTYDRRTISQKVEPAVELLASLNARALEQAQLQA